MTRMTLDEAIKHAYEVAATNDYYDSTACGDQHRQLAKWLIELRYIRKITEMYDPDDYESAKDLYDALKDLIKIIKDAREND